MATDHRKANERGKTATQQNIEDELAVHVMDQQQGRAAPKQQGNYNRQTAHQRRGFGVSFPVLVRVIHHTQPFGQGTRIGQNDKRQKRGGNKEHCHGIFEGLKHSQSAS